MNDPAQTPIYKLLGENFEAFSTILGKADSCQALYDLCTSSKRHMELCNTWAGTQTLEVDNVIMQKPADIEEYGMLCAMSSCLPNMYNALEVSVSTGTTYERNFRTAVINLVMKHGIVAGGFIINNIARNFAIFPHPAPPASDIDVYMDRTEFKLFAAAFERLAANYNTLATHNNMDSTDSVNLYTKSIHFIYSGLANNPQDIKYHIKLNLPYIKKLNPGLGGEVVTQGEVLRFDIVVCSNPGEAVQNFDLSFCRVSAELRGRGDVKVEELDVQEQGTILPLFEQNKWDVNFGDNFADLHKRKGTMSRPFAQEFFNGNRTTRNRVNKYLNRGYSISMPVVGNSILSKGMSAIKSFFHTDGVQEEAEQIMLTLNPTTGVRMRENRTSLPAGKKMIRTVIYEIFDEIKLDWLAEHYDETEDFQRILKEHIYEVDIQLSVLRRQLLEATDLEWT